MATNRWRGDAPASLTVTLAADDVPIAGRVLDLEGKPVAGVAVRVTEVCAFPDGPKGMLEWLARIGSRPKTERPGGTSP